MLLVLQVYKRVSSLRLGEGWKDRKEFPKKVTSELKSEGWVGRNHVNSMGVGGVMRRFSSRKNSMRVFGVLGTWYRPPGLTVGCPWESKPMLRIFALILKAIGSY